MFVVAAVRRLGGLVAAFSADIGSIGGPLDWLIHLLRILAPVAAFGLLAAAACGTCGSASRASAAGR